MSEPGANAQPAMRSLILRGIGWKAASQVLGQVLRIASTIVLARLLAPREFGLAAMALVFGSLAALISDLGLGASLVQRPTLTEEDRSTSFWTSAGVGLVLTGVGVALAEPIAHLYHEDEVAPLIAVFSVTFLLAALGTTQGALLIRDLRFKSLEIRTLVSSALALVVAIVLAARGAGAWALIVQAIVGTGLSTLLLWWSSSWRPRFVYSRASLRELRGMSAAVFGSNLLFYVNRNVDNILISRFLGPAALGLYSVAYNAMLVPLLRLVSPVQQVFFPAFARLERPGEVGALWVRVTRATSALTVPAFVGLAVVAPELVAVVLGSKWHGAARILQVLAVVGVLQGVAWHTRNVLMALGRAQTIFRYSVVSAVLTVTAFAIGVTQGVVAVAVAYAVVTIVLTPAYIRLATQATGLSLLRFARPLAGVFAAAALMGLALLGLRALLVDELAAAPRLVLLVLAGTALYVPLAAWLAPGLRDELRDLRARRRGAATPV